MKYELEARKAKTVREVRRGMVFINLLNGFPYIKTFYPDGKIILNAFTMEGVLTLLTDDTPAEERPDSVLVIK